MNKVLLLHSNLRGSTSLVDKIKTCFPGLQVVPILFLESDKKTDISSDDCVVSPRTLYAFSKSFDFKDVIAIQVSFMTGSKVTFIRHAPKHVKLVWGIPGGDLYNRYLRYFGYELTFNPQKGLKYRLGAIFRRFIRRKEFDYLMNRCCAVISAKCDFDLMRRYCLPGNHIPSHVYSIAYPMDKMLGDLYGQPFVENDQVNVVIGNSASRTNNHLYVLSRLKSINYSDAKFKLLMSYGDSDDAYKQLVRDNYQIELGERVIFVTDYVPLSEFNRRLLEATHFVYGNWRQEAVGNILTALYLGGKVYLSEKNPLLTDFREKGFLVYSLEKIDNAFLKCLSHEEKKQNRELVVKLYNKERADMLFKDGLAPYYQ